MNKSEKFWDRIASQWDKRGNEIEQPTVMAMEKTIKYLRNSDYLLDFGCGTGSISNEIAAHVREIQAIDLSSKMIEVAKRRAVEQKIENVHYVQTTIFDDQFEKGSINVITAFNILHLLENTTKVIHRINELLIADGLFISATPCLGEKLAFLGIFLSLLSKIGIVPYVRLLKFSELDSLIANEGFQTIETEHSDPTEPNYFIVKKKLK